MLKKLLTFIFIVVLITAKEPSLAQDSDYIIRVGISDNNFKSLLYKSAEFTSNSIFDVIDQSTGNGVLNIPPNSKIKILNENSELNVYQQDKKIFNAISGPIIIKPKGNGTLTIINLKRNGKPAFYRGIFEITKNSKNPNQFLIINVLDLESYLKGVVPNEMPIHFGLEALKAQTVAARNYALKPRERFYKEFDVCDSVASQVYFGANTEQELSNLAIKQTNGLVAIHNDELILALYSSTAGGYTENYENAFSDPKTREFPAKSIPHLKAKPDCKDTPNLSDEAEARKFYLSYPQTFDNKSPYFRWEKQWTKDELEQSLKTTLIAQSTTGFIKPKAKTIEDIGSLKNIIVNKRGESGKIMNLDIITDKGTFNISKELVIRRLFTKNGKAMPSANFVVDTLQNPDGTLAGFVFHGGGYGHGVGISQWGAGAMSSQGYKFDEILQHYYSGVSISTPPVTLRSNDNEFTQNFYAPYKKACLCIDNRDNIHSIITIINGKEFIINTADQKKLRIDIKECINKGENAITYSIPKDESEKKTAKMYVEVKEATNE